MNIVSFIIGAFTGLVLGFLVAGLQQAVGIILMNPNQVKVVLNQQ